MSERARLSGLTIVVLAAGFSSRLGRPKILQKIHGISLLRRTLLVLATLTSQTTWVITAPRPTRVRAELRGCRARLLPNASRAGGLSTSVALALRRTRYGGAALLLPADLAGLDPRDLRRLIRRWQGARGRVVARAAGGRASTPLILPAALRGWSQRLSGDAGLRELVAGLPPERRLLVDMPSAARDIDTPHELAAARARAPRPLRR